MLHAGQPLGQTCDVHACLPTLAALPSCRSLPAAKVVLRRSLGAPVPPFLAKTGALVMTVPQAKGLEFNGGAGGQGVGCCFGVARCYDCTGCCNRQPSLEPCQCLPCHTAAPCLLPPAADVFILNFFADSPCKDEWRILLHVRSTECPAAPPASRSRRQGAAAAPSPPTPFRPPVICLLCSSSHPPALQYLAELEQRQRHMELENEKQRRQGLPPTLDIAAEMPFGRPLAEVSASDLGLAGTRGPLVRRGTPL